MYSSSGGLGGALSGYSRLAGVGSVLSCSERLMSWGGPSCRAPLGDEVGGGGC